MSESRRRQDTDSIFKPNIKPTDTIDSYFEPFNIPDSNSLSNNHFPTATQSLPLQCTIEKCISDQLRLQHLYWSRHKAVKVPVGGLEYWINLSLGRHPDLYVPQIWLTAMIYLNCLDKRGQFWRLIFFLIDITRYGSNKAKPCLTEGRKFVVISPRTSSTTES